jgi:hypothetical protein
MESGNFHGYFWACRQHNRHFSIAKNVGGIGVGKMAKFSRPFLLSKRIGEIQEKVKVDTQRLREKLLRELEQIFNEAVKMARGEVTVQGKELTVKQRQLWARVAAYTAQVMQSIAKGFDEHEIDEQLKELRRLVDEAKAKAGTGYTA